MTIRSAGSGGCSGGGVGSGAISVEEDSSTCVSGVAGANSSATVCDVNWLGGGIGTGTVMGLGGQSIGQYGYSKDHRPDLRQLILAVLIDGDGRPVCSEMWPGNTADVTSLVPVIERLRRRFAIGRVCIVADRGMISAEPIASLEARDLLYLLGVRERTDKLVRDVVLNDAAPFVPLVVETRGRDTEYSAKAVMLVGRATSSASTTRRRRRMPPIAPRSSPRWSGNCAAATRRWSVDEHPNVV
jgi:Transposase DDE domain